LSFSFISFLFLFFSELFTMCVANALIKGETEDRWMVAPGCDECLTTWCGQTLSRVLQVQIGA
jgi:hypothetical protein